MRLLAIWVGKSVLWGTRRFGHGGSALPGLIVERIYPQFIWKMAKVLKGGSIIVTGTNGKTTTAKMIRGILVSAGHTVVANRAGSNMSRGVASALLEHTNWRGELDVDMGLFEVDEAFTEVIASKLKPKAIIVLNLLRDQLDRYGELDRTAQLIAAGLPHAQTAVLNADDPLVSALAKFSKRTIFYGAAADIRVQVPFDEILLGHRDHNLQSRSKNQRPTLFLVKATPWGSKQQVKIKYQNKTYLGGLQLLGAYNAYNALAALGAALAVGIELESALTILNRVKPAFGRTELINLGDKSIQLLLVKNPAGFNQIIRTFLLKDKDQPLMIAINDNFADGRDVSWLWDVDFEQMSGQNHVITASGTRGYDLAVRLKYAEINGRPELNLGSALKHFVQELPAGATGYVVPTYTAMLALRRLLARRAKVGKVWQ